MSAPKKQRQPLVSIGANNLYKLACAAANDIAYGDGTGPYVKSTRKLINRAVDISSRAASRKGFRLHQ